MMKLSNILRANFPRINISTLAFPTPGNTRTSGNYFSSVVYRFGFMS